MYNLAEIDKLMNCTPIPLIKNITYLREEKNNFFTFYTTCEYTKELITNKTALQILKLCNSKNKVKDILTLMKSLYSKVSEEILYKDICDTLLQFEKIQIIKWKGGNPIMQIEPIKIGNDYEITIASEVEIRGITNIINNFNPLENDYIFIKTFKPFEENFKSEVNIRYKLFSYSGEYFILKNKNKEIIGLFSFDLSNKNQSSLVYLEYICIPKEVFNDCFNCAKELLKQYCIKDIAKIELMCLSNDEIKTSIDDYLLPIGFIQEAKLKDEFKKGTDLIIYSYFYNN